jgi:hypothetical protein
MQQRVNLPNLARPLRKRRIALALQGGGSHGAFTWGVLDRLLGIGRFTDGFLLRRLQWCRESAVERRRDCLVLI